MKMVDAQQARRVLDRLVGYKISPLLWDKVRRGLSAGRVQSVALKLVCDREREIEAFVPEEYWNIIARLAGPVPPEFDAKLLKKRRRDHQGRQRGRGQGGPRRLEERDWVVASVTTKERKKNAVPPFITSKLQQASRFPVKKTMMVAQQLYEGIELPGEGRSASSPTCEPTRCAWRTRRSTRCASYIATTFGADYLPEKPNVYKTKADAQDAHEAIRPTSMEYDPGNGPRAPDAGPVLALQLIWNRFVASQMPPATFDETTVDIAAGELPVPRQGHGAEVRRLARGLRQESADAKRGAPGRKEDGRGREGTACAAAGGRRPLELMELSRSRSSRSRRRATPRRPW